MELSLPIMPRVRLFMMLYSKIHRFSQRLGSVWVRAASLSPVPVIVEMLGLAMYLSLILVRLLSPHGSILRH